MSSKQMNIKKFFVDFVIIFAVSLIVLVIVTLLWNLIFHGSSIIDWGTSVRFAISFGIVLSAVGVRRGRDR